MLPRVVSIHQRLFSPQFINCCCTVFACRSLHCLIAIPGETPRDFRVIEVWYPVRTTPSTRLVFNVQLLHGRRRHAELTEPSHHILLRMSSCIRVHDECAKSTGRVFVTSRCIRIRALRSVKSSCLQSRLTELSTSVPYLLTTVVDEDGCVAGFYIVGVR